MADDRTFSFYAEIIVVTIVSLVAANAWIGLFKSFLDIHYPRNLEVEFIAALIITMIALIILFVVFKTTRFIHSHSKNNENEKPTTYALPTWN